MSPEDGEVSQTFAKVFIVCQHLVHDEPLDQDERDDADRRYQGSDVHFWLDRDEVEGLSKKETLFSQFHCWFDSSKDNITLFSIDHDEYEGKNT